MSYCMNFYLNWHRNYTWSKLKVCFLLSKYQSSSYDHVQFLCQLRQKFIQQLILKLLSIVKRDAKGQRMLAFLRSKTALCKWDIQYIKPALSEQKFSALYYTLVQPLWKIFPHFFPVLSVFGLLSFTKTTKQPLKEKNELTKCMSNVGKCIVLHLTQLRNFARGRLE